MIVGVLEIGCLREAHENTRKEMITETATFIGYNVETTENRECRLRWGNT
jgi:hypothetical protein